MRVRYKRDGKFHTCECFDKDCPKRECFAPHHYQHKRRIGGEMVSEYDDFLSCAVRNYRGCPDKFVVREERKANNKGGAE